jgi:hypothetical protein
MKKKKGRRGDYVRIFARRRRRVKAMAILAPFVIVASPFLILIWPAVGYTLLFLYLAAFILFNRAYRCPACGSRPIGTNSRGRRALMLHAPENCISCGAKIRELKHDSPRSARTP